ncbi:MAG: murein transglycosylase A [Acidobacteriota bacterium]
MSLDSFQQDRQALAARRLRQQVQLWRRLALGALGLTTAVLALLIWLLLGGSLPFGLTLPSESDPAPSEIEAEEAGESEAEDAAPLSDRARFTEVQVSALEGWAQDDHGAALEAFREGCGALRRRPDGRAMGPDGLGGTAADWKPLCAEADALTRAGGDLQAAAEAFFRQRFRAYQVTNRDQEEGLFTGYYEPSLRGSRRQQGAYQTPLLRRPPELVSVELGDFRPHLRGERISGRVTDGRLQPYADRQAIDDGALNRRSLELLWVDDPVDAFFLHIQGSGRVLLDTGGSVQVGYAGQNGHPYFAIGRALIERGEVPREQMSLQAIRGWLDQNPESVRELLHLNPSYVFFRQLTGPGPLGALGVPLTAGRSLAVDRSFFPLGAPVWLDGSAPSFGAAETDAAETDSVEPIAQAQSEATTGTDQGQEVPPPGEDLRRLFIAQDTGGAIRGPVRGDVFWGYGEEAEERAGRMRHPGRLTLLLPATLPPPGPVPTVDPDAAR